MEIKLVKLYNTLASIETKGESTKIMADCLRYIEQLVEEVRSSKTDDTEAQKG